MTLADFDAAGAAVLASLLTYAIHSTILLAAAALAAWRFADHHAWLDVIWKTALVGPIVTATLLMTADVVPLGGRWSMPVISPVTAPGAAPAQIVDARIAPAVERPLARRAPQSARARPSPHGKRRLRVPAESRSMR